VSQELRNSRGTTIFGRLVSPKGTRTPADPRTVGLAQQGVLRHAVVCAFTREPSRRDALVGTCDQARHAPAAWCQPALARSWRHGTDHLPVKTILGYRITLWEPSFSLPRHFDLRNRNGVAV
jgi:hypothetical protein